MKTTDDLCIAMFRKTKNYGYLYHAKNNTGTWKLSDVISKNCSSIVMTTTELNNIISTKEIDDNNECGYWMQFADTIVMKSGALFILQALQSKNNSFLNSLKQPLKSSCQ